MKYVNFDRVQHREKKNIGVFRDAALWTWQVAFRA
jgi:hypothetical protein